MQPFPTRRPPRIRLLVFARVPELGLVKTRLASQLGPERTLEVYTAMLGDLLASVGSSDAKIEVEVLWTGSPAVTGDSLRSAFGEVSLARQAGAGLGERLGIAFAERLFFHRTEKVVAIGVDDLLLDREQIALAVRLLDSCEWTIGPATDGGYYLIGCRAESFRAEVFDGIEWGTETVFETTAEKIRSFGATLALLPVHSDIDLEDDLRAFHQQIPPHAERTREVLESWGWTR